MCPSRKSTAKSQHDEEEDIVVAEVVAVDHDINPQPTTTIKGDQPNKTVNDWMNNEKFPYKLYRLMTDAATKGFDHIISFLPDGHSFCIHQPQQFTNEILPQYFITHRLTSFQRQLNLHGFERMASPSGKNAYHHPNFRRDCPELCDQIKRKKTGLKPPPDYFPQHSSQHLSSSSGRSDTVYPFLALSNSCYTSSTIVNPLLLGNMTSTFPVGTSAETTPSLLHSTVPNSARRQIVLAEELVARSASSTAETTPSLLHSIVPNSARRQIMLAEELAARSASRIVDGTNISLASQRLAPLQNSVVPGTTDAQALLSLLLQERHARTQIMEQNALIRQWLFLRQQSQPP
jgi:hypothetical protein